MKHDPMCPMTTPDGYLCCCNLIARVREDERKQYAAKWYSQQELDAAVAAAELRAASDILAKYEEIKALIASNDEAFDAGVKAAREAVAAVPADRTTWKSA